MSINCVTVSGNLTRDAELQHTKNTQTAVLNFSVAVNDRQKNQETNEWEDKPNFIDFSLFGRRAESLAKYLLKGTKVSIFGHLRQSSWEKDGQKRSRVTVVVDELEFMSRNPNAAGAADTVPAPIDDIDDDFDGDDDVPF